MLRDDRRDDDDECPRRPADLNPAAAEERDQESRRDGGIEPAFRRQSACDGERHGQRQRHHTDGQPREKVRAERLEIVMLEIGEENGPEHLLHLDTWAGNQSRKLIKNKVYNITSGRIIFKAFSAVSSLNGCRMASGGASARFPL